MNPAERGRVDQRVGNLETQVAEVIRRLGSAQVKVAELSSAVDVLLERQKLQHEENRSDITEARRDVKQINAILVGEKGDNGLLSIVKATNKKMDEFRNFPKKILLYLSIALGLITLLTFLGPSIRKAWGMTASAHPAALGATLN